MAAAKPKEKGHKQRLTPKSKYRFPAKSSTNADTVEKVVSNFEFPNFELKKKIKQLRNK